MISMPRLSIEEKSTSGTTGYDCEPDKWQTLSPFKNSCQQLETFGDLKRSIKNVSHVNTLRPSQDSQQFADAIFKCIFLNENWFFY